MADLIVLGDRTGGQNGGKNALQFEMPDDRPIDGISLLPTIEGSMTERPIPIPYRFNSGKDAMFHAPTLAMMDNRYKCLTNLSNDGSEDLCFDMIEDRAETINLAAEQRERLEQTRKSLRQWLHSCKVSHNGGDYDEAFEPVAPFEEITGDWLSRGNRNNLHKTAPD